LAICEFVVQRKICRFKTLSPFCTNDRNKLSQKVEAKTIGQHIKRKRCELGLTQEKLSALLKVNRTTLSLWECDIERPGLFRPTVVDWLGFDPDISE
jgi:DNA-binding XRE family transcriptional regulator